MRKFLLCGLCFFAQQVYAQQWHFDLSFTPATQTVHVHLQVSGNTADSLPLKMPVWTPGYYQFMNYANNVTQFKASDQQGKSLAWKQTTPNSWCVQTTGIPLVIMDYDVKANRDFVAGNYLDSLHAFLSPAGIFMHTKIQQPVSISIHPYDNWKQVATGMDSDSSYTYFAPDFDVLYDSPILTGNLDTLPSFKVKGIPHYFTGYKMVDFDHVHFMHDLKKIVESAVDIIGEIPYKHYTFMGIGPGRGGIEHLNTTAVSFTGEGLDNQENRIRTYSFLAHEYFHHYNVKRIRPVELGPFDYENGSRTAQLWISEGFTVYYEYLILRRAGLTTGEECLQQLRSNLLAYETKPGRLYQSLTQASLDTWSDGPFGRTGDSINKTISYYDKGPILALLLDLKIRHETGNRKSLDDVMRTLYQRYYKQLQRGFTEKEFQQVCEQTAGTSLSALFEYVSTVKAVDYQSYFNYAGLVMDNHFEIKKISNPDKLQTAIYKSIF
ncbi:Predicted metalloprotease, contains C-terminal PDZ domain [Chitinophaga sp. CF118]|uniref:M61 family metallopeptidase n=1 Tax=Chitinophaga sp. CF118 TaxID=1884367 RepID=UPI0008E95D05|nr:M61 family metallopeptidase [Chitinophaga sp. CF118]SFD77074.1 Predicted metalloprotease, contains C-terminal PDZ domain [Chitinophaga sp. CF118]